MSNGPILINTLKFKFENYLVYCIILSVDPATFNMKFPYSINSSSYFQHIIKSLPFGVISHSIFQNSESSREIVNIFARLFGSKFESGLQIEWQRTVTGSFSNFIELKSKFSPLLDKEELFDYLIDSCPVMIDSAGQNDYKFLYNSILNGEKYKYAKKLMIMGLNMGSPVYLALESFKGGRTCTIVPVIDFLDFIINQRQEFDVNDPIWPLSYNQPNERLIFHLLKGKGTREFKERVAQYLIGNGADPLLTDAHGKTAWDVADEQGINLTIAAAP